MSTVVFWDRNGSMQCEGKCRYVSVLLIWPPVKCRFVVVRIFERVKCTEMLRTLSADVMGKMEMRISIGCLQVVYGIDVLGKASLISLHPCHQRLCTSLLTSCISISSPYCCVSYLAVLTRLTRTL